MANAIEYIKLEKRLVLLAWLNSLFGFNTNQELLTYVKEADEGFDPYGRSYIYHSLVGLGDKLRIPLPVLGRYDDNIRNHLSVMNQLRPDPITLRYFQHMALLYTEIFLDRRFNHTRTLLRELNGFVRENNSRRDAWELQYPNFTLDDLNKLAFWMATGSGKTLIMHFNYRQFLHYNRNHLDNILLITPNDGLTDQHMEEMTASNIQCKRFNLNESGLELTDKNIVRVIEITKLVEEKRGGGVSVPVESFEGNNLIFVDEGHKGSGGEVWRKFRDSLGETGFTFEYSATFGQALTASRRDELTDEYGKAIVFDYSYKYFHGDGYGKDFNILNLREETTEEMTETLLLGNLLSYYEQQRCFKEQNLLLRPYNLDKPLWVFVGSRVNAVYKENLQQRSDVLTVVRFLQRFLENKSDWAVKIIKRIIEGNTGLVDSYGQDIFAGKFEYLNKSQQDIRTIYSDILSSVFSASAGGTLHMCDIRGCEGELGLKVSGADNYFGLIYIGDTSTFKKLVEEDNSGIVLEDDVISNSLFEGINKKDTSINVLIGAKKFMEGWNSWRVSNMGLLNIGRREGSEIIQLFGRGVRLKGKDFSLKRSSALDGEHPVQIRLLENLNIFAVRANYMAQFRDYLEREGVETDGRVGLSLAIKPDRIFLKKGLLVPKIPPERRFEDEYDVMLSPDPGIQITIDMSLKVESMRSRPDGLVAVAMSSGLEQVIPAESLVLVDWERVYLALLEYKEQKGFSNLVIQPSVLREILEPEDPRMYKLIADESIVRPSCFAEVSMLKEAVLSILRKYVEKFYRVRQERWDSEHMAYEVLNEKDTNFQDYVIRIPRSEAQLIKAVKNLIEEGKRIYKVDTRELPNIHFDRHLYQPLLVDKNDKIKSDPPGLKESEKDFVEHLRSYFYQEKDKSLLSKEIFLLRNLSRGKGIGFFNNEGFYPDFILWIKERKKQRIVFIEPHGMRMEKTYWSSDKARLHERLSKLSKEWGKKAGIRDVILDSFIISATPYTELKQYYGTGDWSKDKFANVHILFLEDDDYSIRLFA